LDSPEATAPCDYGIAGSPPPQLLCNLRSELALAPHFTSGFYAVIGPSKIFGRFLNAIQATYSDPPWKYSNVRILISLSLGCKAGTGDCACAEGPSLPLKQQQKTCSTPGHGCANTGSFCFASEKLRYDKRHDQTRSTFFFRSTPRLNCDTAPLIGAALIHLRHNAVAPLQIILTLSSLWPFVRFVRTNL